MTLIKNGEVVDPVNGAIKKTDLLIEKGKITKILSRRQVKVNDSRLKTIDAAGKLIIPGLDFTQGGQTADIQQILALEGAGAHIDHHIGAPRQDRGIRSVRLDKIKGLVEIPRSYVIDIMHGYSLSNLSFRPFWRRHPRRR